MSGPISNLFLTALTWACENGAKGANSRPGLWVGKTKPTNDIPSLEVRFNAHLEAVGDLPPVSIRITPADEMGPIAVCLCGPYGGAISGFHEDQLISHFEAQVAPVSAPPHGNHWHPGDDA